MAEFSLSYEERLLDPEEKEGDDAWTRLKGSSRDLALKRSMGYEKPFLLQGLFNRAGERPDWVKEMWAETRADAPSDGPLELPFKPGEGRGPEQLLRDQMDDHDTWDILNYLRKGEPGAEKVSARDEIRLRTAAAKHTLSPDGFLCRKVHLPLKTAEVPVLPSTGGWRQWAFEWAHDSPLAGHLNASKTFDKLRRCVVWDRMLPDCEFWVESCSRCAQHRRAGVPQRMDPKLEQHTLGPWMDVYVDFTGPYTESDGYRYVCTYTCKLLRVPILEPCRSLNRGDAMQAVMTCMLRSLTIPAVWRHDLGPEFTNALFEEMTVLLGIQERTPPAHRPMAVGIWGKRVHRSMNSLIALLLQDVHQACASEWARVLPLVHYIMMNTPILESGLVPRDLDNAWSLRDHVERELVPFRAPGQLPVDEWAKAVFRNFKTIESTLSRYLAMTEERRAELYDRGHLKRTQARLGDW